MSHNPADRHDAQLAARFAMDGSQHCYVWERCEILDEQRDVSDRFRWYELTFGELPGRSRYAERLHGESRIAAADLATAAEKAAAWVDERWRHESSSPSNQSNRPRLREEDRLLAERVSLNQDFAAQGAVGEESPTRSVEPKLTSTKPVGVFEPWESATLFPTQGVEPSSPQAERLDLATAHVVAIHPELECRVSQTDGQNNRALHVISFFNPAGGLPTVVDVNHGGVQQALREARSWVRSHELQPHNWASNSAEPDLSNPSEHTAVDNLVTWWPVVRRGDSRSPTGGALLGLVQACDEQQALEIASKTLDYGLGPERLQVEQDRARYGAVAVQDRRFVMWGVDGSGRAEPYTSAANLADVVDISSRYEMELARSDQPTPTVLVTEWNEPGKLPTEIVLERLDWPGEPTEFALGQLGRLVSEQEVLDAHQSPTVEQQLNHADEAAHYLIWESLADGTLRRRGYEMDLQAGRVRAVEIAIADRIEHGRLPELNVTAWPPSRDLPSRTIIVGSSQELGRPVPFDLEAAISLRYAAPERPPEQQPTLPEVEVVRVQSEFDLKEGDYVQFGTDPQGKRIGYLAPAGLGPEQLAAPPQYAVVHKETQQVIARRNLSHYAEWAAEPFVDAAYKKSVNLRSATLPPLSGIEQSGGAVATRQATSARAEDGIGQNDRWTSATLPAAASENGILASPPAGATTAVIHRPGSKSNWRPVADLRVAGFAEVQEIFNGASPGGDVRVTSSESEPLRVGDVVELDGVARMVGDRGVMQPAPDAFLAWQQQMSHGRDVELEP